MEDNLMFRDALEIRQPPQICKLSFMNNDNQEVGAFYWDNGIKFEGNAEESARVFIRFLKELWDK